MSLLQKLQRTPHKRLLIFIFMIAVFLRVAAAFYAGNVVTELPGTFDQISYDMIARQLMAGHGFTVASFWWPGTPAGEPTAHWSYLYTLYLTVIYSVVGYQPLAARLIQAIASGILMPLLAYRLGKRFFTPQIGLLSAGFVAVYIYFVYYAAALMTETFYIMGIMWVLDLAAKFSQTQDAAMRTHLIWGVMLGLALAVTILLRQVFLLFAPFLFLWLVWHSFRNSYKAVGRIMITLTLATLIVILAILPWTYRNYQVFGGEFVLLNTNAGFAFYWGNHPIHGYDFISILPSDGPSYNDLIPPELQSLNEAQKDKALLGRAATIILDDPLRYAILSVSRIEDYFKFWPSADSSLISNLSRVFSFGIFLPLMLYGVLVCLRRPLSSTVWLLYLFMAFYTGIHLLTWTLIRYRLPVDAILLIFAGVAVIDLWIRLSRRRINLTNVEMPPAV